MADGYSYAGDASGDNSQIYAILRTALEAHRRAGMLLVQQAIAAGYPIPELAHDETAARNAVLQLIMICARPGTDAPMILGVIE